MRLDRRNADRHLMAVAVAFLLGLLGVLAGVAVFDSRAVVGVALVWVFAVIFYAVRIFRCPLCGATLLYFPVRVAWRWFRTSPRLCPRCRTDFDAALAELARGRERST